MKFYRKYLTNRWRKSQLTPEQVEIKTAAMQKYPRKPGETTNQWVIRALWWQEIENDIQNPIITKPDYSAIDTTYTDDVF